MESDQAADARTLVEGRYELMVRCGSTNVGEVWSGVDTAFDHAVDLLLLSEDAPESIESEIEALLEKCDCSEVTPYIPAYLGSFLDGKQRIWVFEAHQGPVIQSMLAVNPEQRVRDLADIVSLSAQPGLRGLLQLDLCAMRMDGERIRCEHPVLHGRHNLDGDDAVYLDQLGSIIDALDVVSPHTRAGRRIQRAFPQLSEVLAAINASEYETYAEATMAFSTAVEAMHEVVLVVGGGPIVIPSGSTDSQASDRDDSDAPAGRHLSLVDEFEDLEINSSSRRFRLPSRIVIGMALIAAALGAALLLILLSARGVEHKAKGNMPGRDMRRIVGSVSQEQGKVSDLLEAYQSRQVDLKALRMSGAQLATTAQSAYDKLNDIKPGSAPEAELKQTSQALLRAQRSLGKDLQLLPKAPARVTSIDGQVILFSSQEVAKQFVQVTIDLRTIRYSPANPESYSRLPVASKAFLDEVLDQEWKRQENELAARMQRQQQSLKQRITKAEQDFRQQMMDGAYRAWRTQFNVIKSKAEVEMSRGRSLSRNGTCNTSEIQRSLGTRGMLMFQLNTLAPPNESALSEQVALQKRLTTSTASDFAVLSSKLFSEETIVCG